MNKFLKIAVITIISSIISGNAALAQTANFQKALENVKQNLDELVTAKDENNDNELTFRIETFKKVIDFSITEAKDLKIKTLDLDKTDNKAMLIWREKMIDEMNAAIKYYENQKQNLLDNEKTISVEKIKLTAQDFKNWRDENYLPAANQIRENVLIIQEENAIQTAQKRLQKINEDVIKIQKAKIKGSLNLNKYLLTADELIKQSEKINQEAYDLFYKNYALPLLKADTTSTKTELLETTSSDETLLKTEAEATTSTNATSTADTKAVPENIPTLSIKDLVGESLNKVKDAYQNFIEMSNLVRKLL